MTDYLKLGNIAAIRPHTELQQSVGSTEIHIEDSGVTLTWLCQLHFLVLVGIYQMCFLQTEHVQFSDSLILPGRSYYLCWPKT